MTYAEIGNATVKIARVGVDSSISVERFHYTDKVLLQHLQSSESIALAITDKVTAQTIVPLLALEKVTAVSIDDFRDFVGTSYATMDTIGVDRVLNLYGVHGDAVVISCGTAITIDAVFNGLPAFGVIMPGFLTSADGLRSRIPALPAADLTVLKIVLPSTTSVQSVSNGVLLSTALGAIEIGKMLAERTVGSRYSRMILTGGDAPLMQRILADNSVGSAALEIDDALLFRGMIRRLNS